MSIDIILFGLHRFYQTKRVEAKQSLWLEMNENIYLLLTNLPESQVTS